MQVGELTARLELDLREFQSRLKQAQQNFKETGEKLKATSQSMKNIGTTMAAGLTAPIVAAGAVLVKGAADARVAQGKLQASLGLTEQQAKELGSIVREVWKSGFGQGIDEVNQAIISVRQNMGKLAGQELEQVAQGAMTVAELMGEDVSAVTAAAGVAMKNFGISGQEALDLITVAFQKGGNYSGELLDTLREYAPQFSALGLSAEAAMSYLIAGAQNGAFNLDKVGDAMKEFVIRAQDGSDTTVEGFTAIGLNAEEMAAKIAQGGPAAEQAFQTTLVALASIEDPLERNRAGVALFGTMWEDLGPTVVTSMTEAKTSLGDFKGATEEATNALQENNPWLAIQQAVREMSDAVGPVLLSLTQIISENVVPVVKSLADWFSNLSPTGQKVVLVMGAIAAAIGPLLIVAGSLASAFAALGPVFTAAAGAIGAISAPVAIAVGAVAGLIAIGVALYKNWDTVREKAVEIWNAIREIFTETWETIAAVATEIWVSISEFFTETWENIKSTAAEAWSNIKSGLSQAWDEIKTKTENIFNNIKDFLANTWDNITDNFSNTFTILVSKAKQFGRDIMNSLKDGLASVKIPLPDFYINWKRGPLGVKIPKIKFDIDWTSLGDLIPGLAEGGTILSPGAVMVGEEGPEILNLPRGASVTPLDKVPAAQAAGGIRDINVYVYGSVGVKDIAQQLVNELRLKTGLKI